MRAVRYHEHGGSDVLQVDEIDRPEPGPEDVLLEVAAAGVNPVDTYFREGSYAPATLPMTAGVDAAGIVVEIGDRVEGFEVGDPAFATGLGRDRQGTYAEYVAVPEDRIASLPDGVDLVEAGAAGNVAVTAWRALIDHAEVEPAESCLIHGGNGGVGHVAVQLSAATGAHVVTTARPRYHDRLVELGADAVIDYEREDLVEAVREATRGGADVILDHRLHEYLQFDAEVAARNARVIGIGEKEPAVGFERSAAARAIELRLQMMIMFNAPRIADPLARLAYLFDRGDLSIEIARMYDLDAASEAHRDVFEESVFGKLVVIP